MTILEVATASEWRAWLAAHAASETEVWLVLQHKASPKPSVRLPEAVEQALCYGWIDSHARKHTATSFRLRFTPRRERSPWSAVNRARAERLIENGEMTPSGQAAIDHAKQLGTWLKQSNGAIPGRLERPTSSSAGKRSIH